MIKDNPVIFEDVLHKKVWNAIATYYESFDLTSDNTDWMGIRSLDALKVDYARMFDDEQWKRDTGYYRPDCYACIYALNVCRHNSTLSHETDCELCPFDNLENLSYCLNGYLNYVDNLVDFLCTFDVDEVPAHPVSLKPDDMYKTYMCNTQKEIVRVCKLIRDWPIKPDVVCRSQIE